MSRSIAASRAFLVVIAICSAAPARAIPAFARKYATSCNTCHTVYPKLTPFGEAFRANGYRFPGIDGDFIKAEQVVLGQEAYKKTFPNSVWPSSIPVAVPLSIGANGTAVINNTSASFAKQNNLPAFTLQDLAGEGHLWAGASLDDTITTWAELTFGSDGTVDVEHAQLLFNDLLGPAHAVNLIVGHGFPNVTQYGPHSSYLGDQLLPVVPVTAIYRDADAWSLVDNYTGLEVNGVIAGRFAYAVGLNAGRSGGVQAATDNFYGRVGFKLGGMRMDGMREEGEASTGAADAASPWAEDALGVYAFGYQANTRFDPATAPVTATDVANVFGLGARAQTGSWELNVGWYTEAHNHGYTDGSKVTAGVAFGELSYVLYPWMVPVLRVEHVTLKPSGGSSVSDLHLEPGVAFSIRPNVKLVAALNVESASGFPGGGWQGGSGGAGGMQIAPPASGKTSLTEFQSIVLFLAWAM
jgi:hypothetical protein